MDFSKITLQQIGIVVTLLINISVLVWGAAQVESTVESLETTLNSLSAQVSMNTSIISRLSTDVAVIQSNRFTSNDALRLIEIIERVEDKLR